MKNITSEKKHIPLTSLSLFKLGELTIDPENLTVDDGVQTKRLSPKSLHILQYLIHNKDELVTYKKLAEEVWLEEVDETVVYQQIGILRKALGDSSTNSKYIRTYPKKGYQLIAHTHKVSSQPLTPPPSKKLKRLPGLLVLSLFIALVTASLTIRSLITPVEVRDILTQATKTLKTPEIIVGLRSYSLSHTRFSESEENTQHHRIRLLMELLVEYHLDLNPQLHTVHLPESLGIGLLPKSAPNLPKLNFIAQVSLNSAENIEFRLAPPGNSGQDLQPNTTVNTSKLEDAIREYEKEVLAQLKKHNLVPQSQQPFLQGSNSDINTILELAELLPVFHEIHLSLKTDALQKVQGILSRDPENLVAYVMLWRISIAIILSEGSFDISTLLNSLSPFVDSLTTHYPNYYAALHFYSKYQSWMQKDITAAQYLAKAVEKKAFNSHMLIGFSWNAKHEGINALEVDKLNHMLNPFNKWVLTYYVESLLANNRIDTAIKIVNQYSLSDPFPKDWRIAAQVKSNTKLLNEFSLWYQKGYSQLEFNETDALQYKLDHFETTPSRYIGYMLLNAGQAERAQFWLNYGREEDTFYFDMRILNQWVDIWQGKWRTDKWQMNYEHAESRKQYQTAFDKYNLLYLHYHCGQYTQAIKYNNELFPEFNEERTHITKSNFRYAAYYMQMQKSLGNFVLAKKITESLKIYLSQLNYPIERDLDFGIADVEFYSLTGETQKALSLLHSAIMEQGWLPNAFWRWPPLNNNPALRNISQHPQFMELVLYNENQLEQYCFSKICK